MRRIRIHYEELGKKSTLGSTKRRVINMCKVYTVGTNYNCISKTVQHICTEVNYCIVKKLCIYINMTSNMYMYVIDDSQYNWIFEYYIV